MRFLVLLSTLCFLFGWLPSASAYSIYSGFTEGCHEKITLRSLLVALPNLVPSEAIPIPTSKTWKQVANNLLKGDEFNRQLPQLTEDRLKLMVVSLLIGVRSPDTEGHAVTNFSSLREIHADPSAEGQYAHALRGPSDDGPQGDDNAVQGTRDAIIQLIQDAGDRFRDKAPEEQIITVQLYFDFYGLVDIEVWEPAYLIGRSLHALQDSFAHTIRSDDLKQIRHVLNYVDAIAGDLQESVDGLPHSGFMDRCDGDTEIIAEAATLASSDLISAVNQSVASNEITPVIDLMDEWVTYEPGCTAANDYCASVWLDFVRQEPTGPYLEELIGCQTSGQSYSSFSFPFGWISCLLFLLFSLFLKLPSLRRFIGFCLCLVLLMCIDLKEGGFKTTQAEILIQSELHASVLSDAPDRSTLANTYGWGLRGGYTWGSWMGLLHLEQNRWLSTELDDRTKRGTLNAGVGGAYIYANGFIRTSLVMGTSTLLFDTVFDSSGKTGLFFDLRPIEFHWFPTSWLSLNLTPFSFTFVAPVLETPSIRMVLYRTVFGLEFTI